jgi:hypothetical protein
VRWPPLAADEQLVVLTPEKILGHAFPLCSRDTAAGVPGPVRRSLGAVIERVTRVGRRPYAADNKARNGLRL